MKNAIPWLLAGIFFIVGLFTVNDYGMNWDEPARLLRGQAFLTYYLTGKSIQLPPRESPLLFAPGEFVTRYDFLAEEGQKRAQLPETPNPQASFQLVTQAVGTRISYYEDSVWANYFLKYDSFEAGHLPLPELLGSLSNKILYGVLGAVGDIESYHIPYIFICALGIFIVALFTRDISGSWVASAVSGLSLALFPIFFGESHFNMKDPLIASLFAGSIWAFWHWVKSSQRRFAILFIIFVATSLTVKWNIVFLPFIVIPWLIAIRKTTEFKRWWKPKKLILYGCITIFVCSVWMILIWPASWSQPLRAIVDVVSYYASIGYGSDRIQPAGFILFGFDAYPLLLFLAQAPEIVLLLAVCGIWAVLRKRAGNQISTGLLLMSWLLVPIIRYSLPASHAYSGWRQIMEILPPLAILAGIGADTLIQKSTRLIHWLMLCILIISYVFLAFTLIQLHPNENTYFNAFAGGIRGAYEKNLVDPFLTNGNIYKQGAMWINANAEKNARVAILDGRTFALSPVYLRSDISISPYHFSGFDRKGEYILVTDINTEKESAVFSYRYLKSFMKPVHTIQRDGVALLTIYKNDPDYLLPGMGEDKPVVSLKKSRFSTAKGEYLELDFGKKIRLTRIIISGAPVTCHYQDPFSAYDEVIQVLPKKLPARFNLTDNTYSMTEKRYLGEGTVEYRFAAEPAEIANIYVIQGASCFNGGMVTAAYGI